jgi:Bacterial PH domain
MAEVVFDKEAQLKKIQEYLLDAEQLFFVYDLKGAGAGFIGVTDKRIIFFDKSFLSKKKVIISLEYSKIAVIAAQDDSSIMKGFFSASTLEVTSVSGQTWTFEFRGSDKAINVYKEMTKQSLAT